MEPRRLQETSCSPGRRSVNHPLETRCKRSLEVARGPIYAERMTAALTTAIETAATALTEIPDPAERYREALKRRAELDAGIRAIKSIQQGAVNELHSGRSWREVGELLGVSGSRAEQISRGK